MSAMWNPFQRETLAALGHVVYRQAGAPGSGLATPQDADDNPAYVRLLHALANAAGVPIERLRDLPPLDQLRSAAAKRALWPRLRAMRAAAPP